MHDRAAVGEDETSRWHIGVATLLGEGARASLGGMPRLADGGPRGHWGRPALVSAQHEKGSEGHRGQHTESAIHIARSQISSQLAMTPTVPPCTVHPEQ
jgi:hypothetical protein